MMTLDAILTRRLEALDRANLRRHLNPVHCVRGVTADVSGLTLLNFSSNDYLGLARHPELLQAAARTAAVHGTGSTASRLVCGSFPPHQALEQSIAAFKRSEAALTFSSGYATALGTIPALVGPGDFVVIDRLCHASLVDAARLSRARLRVFRHNDVEDLRRVLTWARRQADANSGRPEPAAILVVTESIFSMDGDRAPLRDIVAAKDEAGAWLMVDEAHATGVAGTDRRGCIEELDLTRSVEIAMGTLGKALGTAGGFIAGSRALCDYLLQRARTFMFSTAPPPPTAAAAAAALRIVDSNEGEALAGRLWGNIRSLHGQLAALGWELPPNPASAILPLIVGEEENAVTLAAALRRQGILAPAIRYPTVPRGRARLRVTLSALHDEAHLAAFVSCLRNAMEETGVRPPRHADDSGRAAS